MAEMSAIELVELQQGMNESQKMMFQSQYGSEKKDRSLAMVFSILFGSMGIDRFYLGDVAMGVLKLLTAGGCGIWTVIDWFFIMNRADDFNRIKAREIAAAVKLHCEKADAE